MAMTHDELRELLEDFTVVEIRGGKGTVRDDIYSVEAVYYLGEGPGGDDVFEDLNNWTPLTGYSGQDRYSGPVMHESEYIGGGMADHIINTDGIYTFSVVMMDEPDEYEEHPVIGWMILTRPLDN